MSTSSEGILFTDQYQLSMAQLYFRQGMHLERAEFDYFFRRNPDYGRHQAGYCIAAGLNYGCTTVLMPTPHMDALLREIERHKVRWFLGVPSLYRMLLENDRIDQYDITSM